MKIHKEGRIFLLILLVALPAVYFLVYWFTPQMHWLHIGLGVLFLLFFLIILQFFRSPSRQIITDKTHVLSPADGKVVVIEEVFEPEYFNAPRLQISVFMSPFNVHSNHNPVSGVVEYFRYHAGKYLVAWHPKASLENERTTLVIRTEAGVDVLFRQIAGALAKRIVWYVSQGQAVEQGQEFGFIKFGSRVDVFLPIGTPVLVQLNQKVKGGLTTLAVLKDDAAAAKTDFNSIHY